MEQIAQTNIQLFNQMLTAGYSSDEVARVGEAYKLACKLFVGKYRGSGKTLIAHLVGTGSLAVGARRPANVVGAALLHAAYEDGDFGRHQPQAVLRAAVGPDMESLVGRYHALSWSYSSRQVDELGSRLEVLQQSDRDVVLLRVLNEVEDYLDLATHYHGSLEGAEIKGAEWRLRYLDEVEGPLLSIVERLDLPEMASLMATIFADVRQAAVPPQLRSGHAFMWFAPPVSYRPTLRARFRALGGIVYRLRAKGIRGTARVMRSRLKVRHHG